MKLVEIGESQKKEYNEFVAAEPSGSFLQSFEWGEWQATLGRQVKRYKFQVESGETVGVIQLIKMPLPFGKFYLYAPYGPVWAESEKLQVESLKKALNLIKEKFNDAVFVRVESKEKPFVTSNSALVIKSPNIQPGKTLIVDLSKSEDVLLSEMHNKTRYNIKVAKKHGVEIQDEFQVSIGHGLFFEEALNLIQQTSKRQGFNTFPLSYYKKMADFFAVQNKGEVKLHIYKAIFQNQLLTAAFMFDFGDTRTFLFGGSSEFHKNVMAPYLLHFKAMQDAKALGFSVYDFWGIETSSGETPGFVRFKLGFGGIEKTYSGARDIILNKTYYKTYSLLRKVNKTLKKITS